MNWREQRPDEAMVGAFEAFAPEPLEAVEQPIFREAMSRYGAAVHVITTDGPGGKTGFTATAVCSVTDNPPTLLVCLNRKSDSTQALVANGVFCVNTLAYNDEALSNVFAGRTGAKLADRFNTGAWGILKTGAPALASAIVACDCRVTEINAVGTHNVIFGVVQSVALGPADPALVYHGRIYKSV
jgi:flavin reductase (DIM6/NTAB) family NADH-FMN oxidoreductase RutF